MKVVRHIARKDYPKNYPYQLAGSVYGAFLPLLDGSLDILFPDQLADDSSDTLTFEEYLDTTFSYLRNGF